MNVLGHFTPGLADIPFILLVVGYIHDIIMNVIVFLLYMHV